MSGRWLGEDAGWAMTQPTHNMGAVAWLQRSAACGLSGSDAWVERRHRRTHAGKIEREGSNLEEVGRAGRT